MDRVLSFRVFSRVAEMNSFTAAAASLGLPKASASMAVKALEQRLGARLFHRTTRRVELTQDGHMFYARCRDLLSDIDETETMFRTGEALSGRIRVDMPSRLARFQVIPRLPEFLAAHPGVELELGSTDRLVDVVREGYDCVVRVGPLDDSGLVARRIGELVLINCASPGYLARFGTPRGLRDLARHVVVHYAGVLGQRPAAWECAVRGEWQLTPVRGVVTVNNSEAYVAACVAGLGLIQAPRAGLEADLSEGRLVEVLPRLRAQPLPISILYPHRRHLPRRVRALMDWLCQVIQAPGASGERA